MQHAIATCLLAAYADTLVSLTSGVSPTSGSGIASSNGGAARTLGGKPNVGVITRVGLAQ